MGASSDWVLSPRGNPSPETHVTLEQHELELRGFKLIRRLFFNKHIVGLLYPLGSYLQIQPTATLDRNTVFSCKRIFDCAGVRYP